MVDNVFFLGNFTLWVPIAAGQKSLARLDVENLAEGCIACTMRFHELDTYFPLQLMSFDGVCYVGMNAHEPFHNKKACLQTM